VVIAEEANGFLESEILADKDRACEGIPAAIADAGSWG